jgi:F-type H+-transporting ATPase subunit b
MTSLSTVLLAGGSLIDLDGTIFVQLAIFFIAFLVLRALVFKPMIALFEAREQAIDGARHEAKRMEREASEKGKQFDEALRKIRLEAGEERDRLRQEGQRLERAVLDKVRKETQATLTAAETKAADERTRMKRELDATVPALARQIASRLLGREIRA